MKTATNRIFRFKTARLTASRSGARTPRLLPRLPKPPHPDNTAAPATASPPPVTKAETGTPEHGDSIQLYLREIGQVKLLTPPEELALAKRIQRGDKKAREHMIKANLRLVVKIAHEYEGLGLPLLDLINEGNIGLMKGVDRFDHRKGAKLSTYASWWIKQAIRRALANQAKTIRLPVHVLDRLTQIRRTEVKLRETLDREPTDEEVADDLQIEARRVRRYREASRAPVSLDAPIGDDDSALISETVADANAAAPFARLMSHTDHEMLREVLSTLDDRESRILAMRFGLDGGEPRTLEKLGTVFGVTRERVRQIQEQALKKLREKIEKRERPAQPATAVITE